MCEVDIELASTDGQGTSIRKHRIEENKAVKEGYKSHPLSPYKGTVGKMAVLLVDLQLQGHVVQSSMGLVGFSG